MKKEIKVSNPQDEILKSTAQRILCMSGQGGGKSHTGGILSADFAINYPNIRGFIGTNTYGQLTTSTLDRIFKVWMNEFGWMKDIHYVVDKIPPAHFKVVGPKLKSYENKISFNNGCLIFLGSLDNYTSIDGSEFGWAILDETKDTKEEAVKEVITGRLRQKGLWVKDGVVYTDEFLAKKLKADSWNPLYVLTSPAKVLWINEWFGLSDRYSDISTRIFSKEDYYSLSSEDKHVVIYSAYHNEDNLPENYIEQRKKDLAGNQNMIDALVYGSPIAKSGGEFFSRFERLRHVGSVNFNPELNVHISLDFNVAPYITMTCWHIKLAEDGIYDVGCFDEICLKAPKNNTEDLCNEFKKRYIDPIESKGKRFPGLFYYGDASGQNKSTLSKEHNFDVLERVLKKWLNDNSKRVERYNTSVVAKKNFVNKCYAGSHPIRIKIDERCKNLIVDNEFLKEAPDGGMLKEKAKDPITGGTYEKYGHTGDTFKDFICSAFTALFEKD